MGFEFNLEIPPIFIFDIPHVVSYVFTIYDPTPRGHHFYRHAAGSWNGPEATQVFETRRCYRIRHR